MLWIVMLCRNTAPIAAPPACIIPMHNGVTVSRWLWDTGALMVHRGEGSNQLSGTNFFLLAALQPV